MTKRSQRRTELEAGGVAPPSGVDEAEVAVEALARRMRDEAGDDQPAQARAALAGASMRQGLELAKGIDPALMPLPVMGERLQPRENIELLNRFRLVQGQVADMIDGLQSGVATIEDPAEKSAALRWVALARTDLERGFMWMERAVLRPLDGLAGPPGAPPDAGRAPNGGG